MTNASRAFAAVAVVGGLLFAPAAAPVAPAGPAGGGPPGSFADAAALADAVADGRNLERARKWAEAIRHYDAALDRFAPDRDAPAAEPLPEPIRALTYGLRRSKI
ncbi:hypothetical protein ACG2DA_23025, partial [Alienimonas sp. DA493]